MSRRGGYETSVRANGLPKIMKIMFNNITLNHASVSQSHRQPSFGRAVLALGILTSLILRIGNFAHKNASFLKSCTTCLPTIHWSVCRAICRHYNCICIIKMHLKEIGCEGVNWIHLAQNRVQWRALVNTATKLRVP
jgi:hypothetical protein